MPDMLASGIPSTFTPKPTAKRKQNRGVRNCCVSSFTVDRDDATSNRSLCNIDRTQPNGHGRRAVVRPCLLRRCSFLCRQILGSSRRKVGTRSRRRRCRNRNGASLSAWRQCADRKLGCEVTGPRPCSRAGARPARTSRTQSGSGRAARRICARSARRPRAG